jgi:thioester reductase-like protein
LTSICWDAVHPICGDLCEANFGIDEEDFDRICSEMHAIVHCGAAVNHILPYSFHRAANVEGTRTVGYRLVFAFHFVLHDSSLLKSFEQLNFSGVEDCVNPSLEARPLHFHPVSF